MNGTIINILKEIETLKIRISKLEQENKQKTPVEDTDLVDKIRNNQTC